MTTQEHIDQLTEWQRQAEEYIEAATKHLGKCEQHERTFRDCFTAEGWAKVEERRTKRNDKRK